MSTQEKSRSLYVYESNPPLGKILPVSLQHIIAMFLGTVTVPMVVGGAANVDAATQTLMIQYSLMMAAVATLLQVFRIGPVGARLPIVFSAGFTCVPIFTPIAGQFGLAGVFGSQLIFSVLIILLGLCVGKIHKLFPPIVTGTIIMSIGLSLYPIALKYMAGSEGSAGYGDLRNWLVGAITLAAVLIFNLLGRGLIKMASILLGAIVGYIAALCLNMVSFDSVAAASWISLPQPFYYGMPTFDVSMVLPIVLITVVNVMQSVGDLTGTCVGGFNREPSAKELSGGVISSGISSLLGCVFGVPATSTYS